MRENPNIPVIHGESTEDPPLTTTGHGTGRPTHRSNNSFLGRFSRSPNTPTFEHHTISPFSDRSAISIDEGPKEKEKDKTLPKLPAERLVSPGSMSGGEGYFDRRGDSTSGEASPVTPMSRRTSLMRKVVNGVKRTAKA